MDYNKCMTRNFIIAAIVSVIFTVVLMPWMSLPASIFMLLVLLVVGWFLSAYLCKAKAENQVSDAGGSVAPVMAQTPSTPEPAAEPEATPEPQAEPEPAPTPEPEPEPQPEEPAPEPEETPEAEPDAGKPALLSAARDGKGDDLKKIKGVGPKLEKELNAAGVYHFDQIAAWTKAEVEWADQNLVSFKGRVSRDNWVDQAKELAK